MTEHKFKDGSMWEGGGFSIHIDEQCSENGGGEMCPHCHSKEIKVHTRFHDQSTWEEVVWICPRVVVAENEGGCNSTGVCLDCILEAEKTLPNAIPPAP